MATTLNSGKSHGPLLQPKGTAVLTDIYQRQAGGLEVGGMSKGQELQSPAAVMGADSPVSGGNPSGEGQVAAQERGLVTEPPHTPVGVA